MAHATIKRLGGFAAVSAALIASLALTPGVAVAASYDTAFTPVPDTPVTDGTEAGKLTVEGLQPGDTVCAYRFVESTYTPSSNSLNTVLASDGYGFTLEDLADANTDTDTVKGYASDVLQNLGETEDYQGTAGDDGTATINGLPFGEYLLVVEHGDNDSTVVYQHTIVNFVPSANDENTGYEFDAEQTVGIKREDIGEAFATSGKTVKNDGQWAELSDDYAKGEWAEFKIEALVPAYDADAPVANKTFTITDVFPEQLKGVQNIKVTLNTEDGSEVAGLTGLEDNDSATGFTVNLSGNNFTKVASATKVVITFEAQVQDNLDPNTAYDNTATLKFSSNPWRGSDGGSATDDASIKNYGAFLKKVDENNNALPDATFKLTKDGQDIATDLVTDANGYVWVTGLDEGTYTFTETKAPNGYELAANPSTTATKVDSTVSTANFTPADSTQIANVVDFGTMTNVAAVLGGMLPTTGGAGTVALTAAGVVLVAGAAAFIVRSRKEN